MNISELLSLFEKLPPCLRFRQGKVSNRDIASISLFSDINPLLFLLLMPCLSFDAYPKSQSYVLKFTDLNMWFNVVLFSLRCHAWTPCQPRNV